MPHMAAATPFEAAELRKRRAQEEKTGGASAAQAEDTKKQRAGNALSRWLQRSPIVANMFMTILAGVIGNAITQTFIEQDGWTAATGRRAPEEYARRLAVLGNMLNLNRLLRFNVVKCVLVFCFTMPWTLYCLPAVGRFIETKLSAVSAYLRDSFKTRTFVVAVMKICVDQSVFAPPMTWISLVGFRWLDNALDLGTYSLGPAMPSYERWWGSMLGAFAIWPAAQIINLTIVPAHYQLVYVQAVAVIWNAYLRWMAK